MDASPSPTLMPLGDAGLLVRFGTTLSDAANRRAVAFARKLAAAALPAGVTEIVTNLVSVLVKYDPRVIGYETLAGELRLRFDIEEHPKPGARQTITIRFDGEDLPTVASDLKLTAKAFIAAHNGKPLRVLATGFAPGFVYCGFHDGSLMLPRRATVRPLVPAGTVLFAAGQTAIAATPIPTGWHVIGHTDFLNFDPSAKPPTTLQAGDEISFEAAP
jgi:KipI family sensor histidine kinase inhibitor